MKDNKDKEEKRPPEAEAPPEPEAQEPQPQEEDALEKLQAELAAQKDQYLRVLAEYDNFRKRTAAEKAGIYNNAVSDTVQAILPIADNIERALGQENASAEDMRKGVEMIQAQIEAAFEKLGITAVGEAGEALYPQLHNAVAHIEGANLGGNVIAALFPKGC